MEALWQAFADSGGRLVPAVWSSMAQRNLRPLVLRAIGGLWAGQLAFCWGQEWCTLQRRHGGERPLLRKDLSKLDGTPWGAYLPDSVLLVDDDPLKCSPNDAGTAVHPVSFRGVGGPGAGQDDGELLKLAGYLRALDSREAGVRDFVRSNPYHAWPGASDAARDAMPAEDSPGALLRRAAAAFGLRPVDRNGDRSGDPAERSHPLLGGDRPGTRRPVDLPPRWGEDHGWGPRPGRGLDGPAGRRGDGPPPAAAADSQERGPA